MSTPGFCQVKKRSLDVRRGRAAVTLMRCPLIYVVSGVGARCSSVSTMAVGGDGQPAF